MGACLLEKEAFAIVKPIVKPSTFYKQQNEFVYTAMLNLFKRGVNSDIMTVVEELKRMEKLEVIGGAYYVSSLTNRVASSANIEHHARILVEKELKRECIRLGTILVRDAYDDSNDVFELIDKNIQQSFQLINFKTNTKTKHIKDVHDQSIEQMFEIESSGKASGISSGIEYLDNITNGWQNSDLIIVAARPGMGKTCFALQLIKHPSLELNIPTAFFSLEMSSRQIMGRLQSSESYIDVTKIITNNLNRDEILSIQNSCHKLSKAPIYIDDSAKLSIFDFNQKAKKLVIEHGVKMIVVDYLQLMSGDGAKGTNREQEISQISRGLKQTAKELEIPIIALAQLSRTVESRVGDKSPMLSDLRESGSIEQDADMVIFNYRPEYYGIKDDIDYFNWKLKPRELLMCIIAKHRNGALGRVPMKFKGKFMRIDNYDLDAPQSNEKIDEAGSEIV